MVSVDGLMQMNDLSELKARMNEFDLVLPGEKLILEAAEEARLPKEIDIKLYLKMFMRYLHKNHKRMYLLVESEEDGQEAFRYMQRTYRGQTTCWSMRLTEVKWIVFFRHCQYRYRKIL